MGREIIKGLKDILTFYKEIGFDYLPFRFEGSTATSHTDRDVIKDKAVALEGLRKKIGNCQRCKLSKNRKNIVFGEGNPEATLMFIGEAPGMEEDIQARPFVGKAGEVLTNMIKKMELNRGDVYIANIVKCRPPNNREPMEDEISACMPYLEEQIDIIKPKVIFSLGKVSAHALLGVDIPISKMRGNFYNYKGIPLMPTFHPAYLIRNPKDKWLTWEDAQKVLKKLKEDVV